MGGPGQEKEKRRTSRNSAANDIDVKREHEAAGTPPPSKRVKTELVTPKKKSKSRVNDTPQSKGGPMMDLFTPMSPGNVKEGVNSSIIALFKEVSVHSLLLSPII
jgi:hypothetical protein